MVDYILKIVPDVFRAFISTKKHKRELLSEFVLDAIGMRECLSSDHHEDGTVSFETIDRRVRLLQEDESGRAKRCGVPAVDDVMRAEKMKEILRELVIAGKLQRCRETDRWKICPAI
jgi:hypothetical protein